MPSTKTPEGRTRVRRARRKHKKAEELWDPDKDKWKKYIRCEICGRAWVCNNYPDRKPRLSPGERIGGKKVCVWCRGRNGKQIVQWMLLVERLMAQDCQAQNDRDVQAPDCKCLPCVARRIGTEVPKRGHA